MNKSCFFVIDDDKNQLIIHFIMLNQENIM